MKPMSKIIIGMAGLLLLAGTGVAQDLQATWDEYLAAETRYQTLKAREQHFTHHQEELHRKQRQLQEKQAWYNGWIVKMQLSGVSEELVAVADSLQTVRDQRQTVGKVKSDRFREFKQLYLAKAEDDSASYDLAGKWADQADLIIRTVANSNNPGGALPDYSNIVNKLYEDEQTRQLVLSDLQEVITRKINYIDTLLASRRSDLALLKSMADFRKDVMLQSHSDVDVSRTGMSSLGDSREITGTTPTYSDGESSGEQPQYPLSTEMARQSSETGTTNDMSVQRDIQELEHRRSQYHELLRTIEKELHH